jgi:hypothetical protein
VTTGTTTATYLKVVTNDCRTSGSVRACLKLARPTNFGEPMMLQLVNATMTPKISGTRLNRTNGIMNGSMKA